MCVDAVSESFRLLGSGPGRVASPDVVGQCPVYEVRLVEENKSTGLFIPAARLMAPTGHSGRRTVGPRLFRPRAVAPRPIHELSPSQGVSMTDQSSPQNAASARYVRRFRLRFPGICGCGTVVPAGRRAGYDSVTSMVVCATCLIRLDSSALAD